MTAQQAATALAATPTKPCVRRPGSVWTACTCPPCRADVSRNVKLWRNGRAPRPPRTAEARARLRSWLAAGWSTSAIAASTGMKRPATRMMVLLHQDVDRPMNHATVTAILNAPADPPSGRVLAVGSRRRLEALGWLGWSLATLAERYEVPVSVLSVIRSGKVRHTEASTARAIRRAFTELQQTQGPNVRTRNASRAAGWAPPAAWDDETIDAPSTKPVGLVARTTTSQRVDDVVLDEIRELHRVGWSDSQIAERLRRSPDAVQKLRQRKDIRRAS